MKKVLFGNNMNRMPGWAFRMMAFMFKVADLFQHHDNKLDPFNIRKGQTVIDYGSGTGRYLPFASEHAGENGMVYAVDIHPLAVRSAERLIEKQHLKNVRPLLTDGITVGLPSNVADIIYALDMFHMVSNPTEFLKELQRLTKPDGVLFLEDGHQKRSITREKIINSVSWVILEETKTYVKCRPAIQEPVHD